VPVLKIPIIFAGIAVPIIEHALLLGDHTKQVLAKIAGYGPEELKRLRTAGLSAGTMPPLSVLRACAGGTIDRFINQSQIKSLICPAIYHKTFKPTRRSARKLQRLFRTGPQ
jgi:hypothetical protein